MRKILLSLFMSLVVLTSWGQNVIISEVVSGSADGGFPKFIELTNAGSVSVNLNGYKINAYTNGAVTPKVLYSFSEDFVLPASKSVVIANIDTVSVGERWSDYNLPKPEYFIFSSSSRFGNGDDVYELVNTSGDTLDSYGEIGTDGTGENWEYYKSYAYRKSAVHKSASLFDWIEWEYGGKNALVGHESDMSAFLTPGTHSLTTPSGTIVVTSPADGDVYETGQDVTITWTQTGVTNVMLAVKGVDEDTWEYIVNSPVDATTGSMDFKIPEDAEDGDYLLKIVDFDNPPVSALSDTFHISDKSFAGLNEDYPFYPENGSIDVPTDVFDGRLKIYFKESIQCGTGNIFIRRFDNDVIVRTFSVTNNNEVVITEDNDDVVQLVLSGTLVPNTKFYVEVEAGAITDRAATPNSYTGFNNNSIWSFTTGAGDSYISIRDVQEPDDDTDDSPLVGSSVKVKGVVMYKYYPSSYNGFYLQDASDTWCSIYVYEPENDDVEVGDSVTVAGIVEERLGVTRIKDVMFKYVHEHDVDLYDPVIVGLDEIGEEYESLFVRVEDVTCSNPDLGSGKWEIMDGNNLIAVIDDRFYRYTPTLHEHFEHVSGILHYYNGFMIEPVDAGNIVTVSTLASDEKSCELNIVPNPFGEEIRIMSDVPMASVSIMNITGREVVIVKSINSTQTTVSTGELKKGLYIVKVVTTGGIMRIKKVVKR